jgi:hypothetical protein
MSFHIPAWMATDSTSRITVMGPQGSFDVRGQEARTLRALVRAGDGGVTALELSGWALRLAAYVHSLQKKGVVIAMEREPHDGGHHGRYRLMSTIHLIGGYDGEAAV